MWDTQIMILGALLLRGFRLDHCIPLERSRQIGPASTNLQSHRSRRQMLSWIKDIVNPKLRLWEEF
jgi:hypothetical protein